MNHQLTADAYGKRNVRLTKVIRRGHEHSLIELTIDIELVGRFQAAFVADDNHLVIPTDTIKNIVYVLAKEDPVTSIESFAHRLAEFFLQTYSHVDAVSVRIGEDSWNRLHVQGQPHPYAFARGAAMPQNVCTVRLTRDTVGVDSGIEQLSLLKTTQSSFCDFWADRWTTLQDADDRILATTLSAVWSHATADHDWNDCRRRVLRAMLDQFASHHSPSVQSTLYQMASAALNECPELDNVALSMPNLHRVLVDLQPFGLTNDNELFVPTESPQGMIRATVRRELK